MILHDVLCTMLVSIEELCIQVYCEWCIISGFDNLI